MEKRVLLWEKEAVKENSKGTPEELWHREQMQTTWHSYFPGLRRVKGSLGTARPWRTFEKHIDTRLTLRRCGTAKVSSPNFQGSVLRAPVGIVFFGPSEFDGSKCPSMSHKCSRSLDAAISAVLSEQTKQKAPFCPSALIWPVYFKAMWRLVV